jgi:hypothetical protein
MCCEGIALLGQANRRHLAMVDAILEFFKTGCQHYLAGRYAAFAGLNPVIGNVLHRAIENFLKGG